MRPWSRARAASCRCHGPPYLGAGMDVVLEYQRHIARATAHVRVPIVDPAAELRCDVERAELRAELRLQLVGYPDVRRSVPWPVRPGSYTAAWRDGYTLTMSTDAPTRDVPLLTSPWLASEELSGLQCARCTAQVAAFKGKAQQRPLPSESWEELVDAWMCHGDQRLNTSVSQGREGVDARRLPAADEVWIGSLSLKTSSAVLRHSGLSFAPAPAEKYDKVRSTPAGYGSAESWHRPPTVARFLRAVLLEALQLILRVLDQSLYICMPAAMGMFFLRTANLSRGHSSARIAPQSLALHYPIQKAKRYLCTGMPAAFSRAARQDRRYGLTS